MRLLFASILDRIKLGGPILAGGVAACLGLIWLAIAAGFTLLGWRGAMGAVLGIALVAIAMFINRLANVAMKGAE